MTLNIGEVKRISIVGFMRRLGFEPVRLYGSYALFHAPYRKDVHPSFKVNIEKNRWYDLATCQSGDIIDLGCLLFGLDNIIEVVNRLQGNAVTLPAIRPKTQSGSGERADHKPCAFADIKAVPLTNSKLLDYMTSRRISIELAKRHCVELHFGYGSKRYYGIGFRNESGGYEVRNSFFKGTVGRKDISLVRLGEHNDTCMLFEGFMDFLSYLTINRNADFLSFISEIDCVALNSVSNLKRALPLLEHYETVCCCLDNDDAGRRAADLLAELRGGVHDVSEVYKGFKDLNDYLCRRRYYP